MVVDAVCSQPFSASSPVLTGKYRPFLEFESCFPANGVLGPFEIPPQSGLNALKYEKNNRGVSPHIRACYVQEQVGYRKKR
jgi:hypothetical protein